LHIHPDDGGDALMSLDAQRGNGIVVDGMGRIRELHILVNNAGVTARRSPTPAEDWNR